MERGSEERKNYLISNKVYLLDCDSFLSFLLNRRFGEFFPPSLGLDRVNEGNKQDASFLSPQQCLKF